MTFGNPLKSAIAGVPFLEVVVIPRVLTVMRCEGKSVAFLDASYTELGTYILTLLKIGVGFCRFNFGAQQVKTIGLISLC